MKPGEAANMDWPDDGVFRVFKTTMCPYCVAAVHLLKQKNLPHETIDISGNDEARQTLTARTGMRTVPQIWHGGTFVGGYQELVPYVKSKGL